MAKLLTNAERVLHAVLNDSQLAEFGQYAESEYADLDKALASENPVVVAVAKIINSSNQGKSEKDIYNEVSNYLKQSI